MCRGVTYCEGTIQNPCCLAFYNLQVNLKSENRGRSIYSSSSSLESIDSDTMGNSNSVETNRQENYALDGNGDEPVIIREVKPAHEKPQVQQIPVLFKWQEPVNNPGAGVFLSGSFNDWQRQPMKLSDNEYVETIEMAPGKYEYKFFVDGVWKHDPKLNHTANKYGSFNNVITVSVSDASLCISCKHGVVSPLTLEELGSEKDKYSDDGFSSQIPDMGMYNNAGPPPQLPVQLSRGILNSETDQSTDPTLLPEPQHVLLNHLYALTVRDGVMVLGATHRYKRKYVTTMLYKPIIKEEY